MKDVIFWELRRRRSALIWWSFGSAVLIVVILALYPSIRDQAHQLNKVINTLPQGLRELKSGGANSVDVADPIQFLNSQLYYATLPIIWIVLAITRGSAVLGKEEQTHTLELLLARPLSRGRLLAAKALSLLFEFAIIGLVAFIVNVIAAPLFDIHVASSKLAAVIFYTALFSLSFGFIAFVLQAASSATRRLAVAVSVIIGFGGYVIASLSGLTDWLKVPVKFAPYHYFSPQDILHGKTPRDLLIYLAGVLVIGWIIAYFGFRRRDIA